MWTVLFFMRKSFVWRQSSCLLCSSPTDDRLLNSKCFRSNKRDAKPPSPPQSLSSAHGCGTFLSCSSDTIEAHCKHWPVMWGERERGTAWSPSLCWHSPALTSAQSGGLAGSTVAIRESPVYLPGRITVWLYYILSKQRTGRGETQRQREREWWREYSDRKDMMWTQTKENSLEEEM